MSEAPDRNPPWPDLDEHRRWLEAEGRRLLDHYARARVPGGFGALTTDGSLSSAAANGTLTARMAHVYALAAMQDHPGADALADHGIAALLEGGLRDALHDGWYEQEDSAGRKQAYLHVFVGLAAASTTIAGRPRAAELLEAAATVLERHFWREEEGAIASSFARDWSDEEDYRGANANMHGLEAFLALADASGDAVWLRRGLRIATRFVHETARPRGYLLPEHFGRDWRLLADYARDRPADSLRPWGMTPGHFVEWSHLLLRLEAALAAQGSRPPAWLLEDAEGLFHSAIAHGWSPDGSAGLVYTIGWDLAPAVVNRPHWVQAEAAVAALALYRRTGDPAFAADYRDLWDYIDRVLVDRERGSWRQEVAPDGTPAGLIYPLRDDLYHAYQATLAARLPLTASLAGGLREALCADS